MEKEEEEEKKSRRRINRIRMARLKRRGGENE